MSNAVITLARLEELGACEEQREMFEERFGESVKVTVKLCVGHASAFDWDWAARQLLTAAAWSEYEKVTASAWSEYQKAVAPARAEYEKVRAPAWSEYEKVRDSARSEYVKVRAAARSEFEKVRAAAFACAFKAQGSAK